MIAQPINSKVVPVLNTPVLAATMPEPFTDIVLHWLPPLTKMHGQARIVAVLGDWSNYNPDAPLAGCSKPWPGVIHRISRE